jgi:type I restriction enzyme, S subunit
MASYKQIPLDAILSLALDDEPLEPDKVYQTAGVLNRGRGLFKRLPHYGKETKYRSYRRIHSNQVIYSRLFGWEGSIALVESDFDNLYVSPEFPTFDINTDLATPEYIRFLVRWEGLHRRMADCVSGIGQRRQRVRESEFLSIEIPLPDINEQYRISGHLSRLFEIRQEATRSTSDAARNAQNLHNSLFGARSPEVRAGDILHLMRAPVPIGSEEIYKYIGVRSFGKGLIHYPPTPGRELSKLRYFELPPGALVLSNIKAWEGAIATANPDDAEYIASNRFLSYLPTDYSRVDTRYLCYFFLSRSGLPLIEDASPGAADRNRTLGISAFENISIPLPPMTEQRFIASVLDKIYQTLDRIREREHLLDAMIASALNESFSQVVLH